MPKDSWSSIVFAFSSSQSLNFEKKRKDCLLPPPLSSHLHSLSTVYTTIARSRQERPPHRQSLLQWSLICELPTPHRRRNSTSPSSNHRGKSMAATARLDRRPILSPSDLLCHQRLSRGSRRSRRMSLPEPIMDPTNPLTQWAQYFPRSSKPSPPERVDAELPNVNWGWRPTSSEDHAGLDSTSEFFEDNQHGEVLCSCRRGEFLVGLTSLYIFVLGWEVEDDNGVGRVGLKFIIGWVHLI